MEEPDCPTGETAPCLSCGAETPLPEEVHSPVCFRPLCEDCEDS